MGFGSSLKSFDSLKTATGVAWGTSPNNDMMMNITEAELLAKTEKQQRTNRCSV